MAIAESLVNYEVECLGAAGLMLQPNTKIALVGSGPLPLTAYQLQQLVPKIKLTCIDQDAGAHLLARNCFRLDADFVTADIMDLNASTLNKFDVVILGVCVRRAHRIFPNHC